MTTPVLSLEGAQAGDIAAGDIAGQDMYKTTVHGLPPEQLLPLIADALGDEQQYRRLEAETNARRHEATDARLDRMAIVLDRVVIALVVQAALALLLLLIVGQTLFVLLRPHLIGGI